jgi:L-2,4-diaminobutyrate decarboxylase
MVSPFDPEAFRHAGHRTIDLLADYLAEATRRAEASGRPPMPVLPSMPPEEAVAAWPADFTRADPEGFHALIERVVRGSNHLHHPRYVGHQVTSPLPLAALADLVAALLNNGGAVYEMGPVSTAMERSLAAWFGAQLGFGPGCDATFTSGGSAGNLTALLAARQACAGFDSWTEGAHAGPPLAVLASDQTHYCVKRSVQIMGWGAAGVAPVSTDARYRMRPDALEAAHRRAESAGRKVIAVVASAGSTATGAIDPLDAIADYCEAHGLWLHVDGAHGASLALSERYRPLLRGIERADSVVWDAHKMLLVPALVTIVAFREGGRSYSAFAQDASYLFAGNAPEEEWFNAGVRTLECTKRMMSLKVYASLAAYGAAYFGDYVTRMVDLAKRFAAMIRTRDDFEVAVEPDCNIVCFRYVGGPDATAAARNALQLRIREQVLASGAFYLVQTRLRDEVMFLRVTLINPLTTEDDLAALIEAVAAAGDGGGKRGTS